MKIYWQLNYGLNINGCWWLIEGWFILFEKNRVYLPKLIWIFIFSKYLTIPVFYSCQENLSYVVLHGYQPDWDSTEMNQIENKIILHDWRVWVANKIVKLELDWIRKGWVKSNRRRGAAQKLWSKWRIFSWQGDALRDLFVVLQKFTWQYWCCKRC